MDSSVESFPHSGSEKLVLDVRMVIPAAPGVLPSPGVNGTGSSYRRSLSFWMVFLAICLSLFLFALEMVSVDLILLLSTSNGRLILQTAVSTILPTVVSSLNGHDFVWVSSAYSLASTCLIPATGGLAEVCPTLSDDFVYMTTFL